MTGDDRLETRLYVPQDLGTGGAVGLTAEQAHYLKHVLRLDAGARVALFNGRDGEWVARIDGIGRGWASLTVDERRREQPVDPDLWLVFAPIKRARIDFIAQKATELGVSALVPVFTRFTQMTRVNNDRLLANAIEAAEQSARLSVPEVREPARLAQVLDAWPEGRRLILCDETGEGAPIDEALRGPDFADMPPSALLIGPEGGFAEQELDRLGRLPFVTRVSLGPRVLRADTAALAALACWQALVGDWVGGRPDGLPLTRDMR